MGKGKNNPNCTSATAVMYIDQSPEEFIEATVAATQQEVYEETHRAKSLEDFEKEFAEHTLEHARKMHARGADPEEVRGYFRRREAKRARERARRFARHGDFQDAEEVDYEAGMSLLAQLAARRTYSQLGDPTTNAPVPAALRFQEMFMNSPDFQYHLKNILGSDTTSQLAAGAVAGKDMEDAYRLATLRTIGVSEDDPAQTMGRWVSPPPESVEYEIEVLREFSGSAMIDLVMMAKEKDADMGEVYSMQWKSYQTNDTIANTPTPGRSRDSEAVRVDRLTDIPDSIIENGTDEEVIMAAIQTAQLRLLATNTFVDTSSYKQNAQVEAADGELAAGRADWITYTTRMSRPEVHQAITQADPAELLKNARINERGKVVIPVEVNIDGEVQVVEIQTKLSGKKIKTGPSAGSIKLSSRRNPKISLHMGVDCWRTAHMLSVPGVVRVAGWVKAGKDLGAFTLEELDSVIPQYETDFRGA